MSEQITLLMVEEEGRSSEMNSAEGETLVEVIISSKPQMKFNLTKVEWALTQI